MNYSYKIIFKNIKKNIPPMEIKLFEQHANNFDNITNHNSNDFNSLEFGTHQLEISNLTTGITYKYPFQVTEKYQEIDVK